MVFYYHDYKIQVSYGEKRRQNMKFNQKEMQLHEWKNGVNGFEGWYFRISDPNVSLAIIVGISTAKEDAHVFIQSIDTHAHASQVIRYSLSDFTYQENPFELKIKNNYFREDGMILDLDGDIKISGDIKFSSFQKLDHSLYSPTIMGPFSYIPNMECTHALISLSHAISGSLKIIDHSFNLDGIGYIEKDRGTSFPNRYIWFQSNNECHQDASLFFASANIPIGAISFQGTIATLRIQNKQYHFATYYGSRIKKAYQRENSYYIVLHQYPYQLYIKVTQGSVYPLAAPVQGMMSSRVHESIDAKITLHLYKHRKKINDLHFEKCGCEILKYFD